MFKTKTNVLYGVKSDDSGMYIYTVGNLVRNIPFLTKKKDGSYVTPFFKVNSKKEISMITLNKKAYAMKNNHIQEIDYPKFNGGYLRLPTIAINLSESTYKICQNFLNNIDIKRNGKDITVFLPFLGFEQIALDSHTQCHQGDLISLYGQLRITNTGLKKTPILWTKDLRVLRIAQRNIKAVSIDPE